MANLTEDGQHRLEALEAAGWKIESEHNFMDVTYIGRIGDDDFAVTHRHDTEDILSNGEIRVPMGPNDAKVEASRTNLKVLKKSVSAGRSDTTTVASISVGVKNDSEVEFIAFGWANADEGREGMDQYTLWDGKPYTNFSGFQSPGWGRQYPLGEDVFRHLEPFRSVVGPALSQSVADFCSQLTSHWQSQANV